MATVKTDFESFITKAIRDSITAELNTIANEEIAKAQVAIEKRLHEKMAAIAVQAHAEYMFERRGSDLIITVKNGLKT